MKFLPEDFLELFEVILYTFQKYIWNIYVKWLLKSWVTWVINLNAKAEDYIRSLKSVWDSVRP